MTSKNVSFWPITWWCLDLGQPHSHPTSLLSPVPKKHLAGGSGIVCPGISGVSDLKCTRVKLADRTESLSWFSQMLQCSLKTGSFQLSDQTLSPQIAAGQGEALAVRSWCRPTAFACAFLLVKLGQEILGLISWFKPH